NEDQLQKIEYFPVSDDYKQLPTLFYKPDASSEVLEVYITKDPIYFLTEKEAEIFSVYQKEESKEEIRYFTSKEVKSSAAQLPSFGSPVRQSEDAYNALMSKINVLLEEDRPEYFASFKSSVIER